MLVMLFVGMVYAQEGGEGNKLGVPTDTKGVQCSFTEPFISVRYNYQQNVLVEKKEDGVNISKVTMKLVSTNPFTPKYNVFLPNQKKPSLVMQWTNNGSDGMSDILYPLSATWNGHHGACFFVDSFGTHVVSGTSADPEPWLNIRSEASTSAGVLGKLYDGIEVTVLETNKNWVKVRVVTGQLANTEGWVSSKFLQKITP
jgi:hypothetical protein